MGNNGWIKLYRDVMEHWVYEDPLLLKVWITILLLANHEENKILINGKLVVIHRGQFWTSVRKLSERVRMKKDTVQKKLNLLQSDGMIYRDSRKGIGTLITVRNYELYQGFSTPSSDTAGDTQRDTAWDNVQTQRGTHRGHKQEYKNYKNEEEVKNNSGLAPDDPDYFEEV